MRLFICLQLLLLVRRWVLYPYNAFLWNILKGIKQNRNFRWSSARFIIIIWSFYHATNQSSISWRYYGHYPRGNQFKFTVIERVNRTILLVVCTIVERKEKINKNKKSMVWGSSPKSRDGSAFDVLLHSQTVGDQTTELCARYPEAH
jgi:hypothetical protein